MSVGISDSKYDIECVALQAEVVYALLCDWTGGGEPCALEVNILQRPDLWAHII